MEDIYGLLSKQNNCDINKCNNVTNDKIKSRSSRTYTDDYIQIEYPVNVNVLEAENEHFLLLLNGNIYNISELKTKLLELGIVTEGHADVLLKVFILEHENIVKLLRGMFILMIWDKRQRSLFVGRDSFGIKPFYYKEKDGVLSFSTKKRYLFDTGLEALSKNALQDYLTFQYVPAEGLVKGIEKLKPGHYLTMRTGEKSYTYEYCHLKLQPNEKRTLSDTIKQTREALEDSVYAHMKSNQSIGAYLSGGIDSTSLVALAKQYKPDIQTFTVGFERQGYNECDLAHETAIELGVENIQKIITPEEVIIELPNIIRYMDDPIADPAAIPNYFLAREAKKYVDVVLSGEGADEIFGGYNIYREAESLKIFSYIPNSLKCMINRISLMLSNNIKGKSFLWRGTTPIAQRYVGNAFIFNEKKKKDLLQDYDANRPFTAITKNLFQNVHDLDEPTKMQYIDIHTWLSGDILPVAHQMSGVHSLDMRVPFLDKKVFEVARTIPTSMKMTKGTTKYILRQAMQSHIPNAVSHRRKLGFPVPIRHWLKDELYEWAKSTIDKSPTDDIFYKQEIQNMLAEHVQNKQDYSRELWTVLTFMTWYEVNIESFDLK